MQSDSAQSETGLDDKFQELMQKSNDKFIEDLASDGELFWNLLTKLPDESNRKFLIKLVNAQFEKPDLFASLINFKAQPDQGQSDKINLFLRAIKEGHYEFAKFLSKSGADLRSTDTNNNNFEDLIRNKVNTEHHDKTKEEKQKIVFDLSSEIRSVNPSILQEVYYQRNIKIPVKITQDPKLKAYHQYLKEALDTKILASQLTRHASFQDTRGQIERDVAEKLIPEQVHKILIAPALDIIQARRLHGDATGLIDSSRDFPHTFNEIATHFTLARESKIKQLRTDRPTSWFRSTNLSEIEDLADKHADKIVEILTEIGNKDFISHAFQDFKHLSSGPIQNPQSVYSGKTPVAVTELENVTRNNNTQISLEALRIETEFRALELISISCLPFRKNKVADAYIAPASSVIRESEPQLGSEPPSPESSLSSRGSAPQPGSAALSSQGSEPLSPESALSELKTPLQSSKNGKPLSPLPGVARLNRVQPLGVTSGDTNSTHNPSAARNLLPLPPRFSKFSRNRVQPLGETSGDTNPTPNQSPAATVRQASASSPSSLQLPSTGRGSN